MCYHISTSLTSPSFQPHRSNMLLSPLAKFTPSNQTMESQPTLDDIMAKINNILQIMNSSNQNSKNNVHCVIPIIKEVKEKSDNNVVTVAPTIDMFLHRLLGWRSGRDRIVEQREEEMRYSEV